MSRAAPKPATARPCGASAATAVDRGRDIRCGWRISDRTEPEDRGLHAGLDFADSFSKAESKCPDDLVHRQVKYLNNVVEADHGKLKQLIRPVRGFKTLKTAYATIKGFEVMRALRKGQAA